jgi:hypothetical protein
MTALPTWATSPEARALIAQTIASRPTFSITRGQWIEGGGQRRYIGRPSARLRRLHRDWLAGELAALDAQYEVTGHFDHEASAAVVGAERPDALIERLLRESERIEEKSLGDGWNRWAA